MNNYQEQEELEEENSIDLLEIFFRYLHYWKWFVVTILISMILGFVYLKLATPVYEIKTSVLLKDDKKGGGIEELDGLKDLGLFNMKNNVDNELEVLQTATLTEQVVRKMGLYVSYMTTGFRATELYGDKCPVLFRMSDNILDTLSMKQPYEFTVEVAPNGACEFTGMYREEEFSVKANLKDSIVALPFGLIYMTRGAFVPTENMVMDIQISNPLAVADFIQASMSIELTSKTTSVVSITLKTRNLTRGKDFLNTFIQMYNQENMKDQNLVANNTAIFIEERLASITSELSDVESKVENYKQAQGLTDITSEAGLFIEQTGTLEEKRLEIETQLSIITFIDDYMNKKENRNQLLPANTGVQNISLSNLINEYNTLVLKKKRLENTASPTNQIMVDLTAQIESMYNNVLISIRNEKRSQQLARKDLMDKSNENMTRIRAIPRQEREYTEIKRQQGVKESLFLFLLKKKEENYLSMTMVVPNAKIIDKPRTNGIPVSPKRSIIFLLALAAGFILPVLVIYFREVLRYQIENKEELQKISDVPVLGEIPRSTETGNVVIHEHGTDSFTEMIRLLRTNLLFVLNDPSKKIINVVSSISGEGKTFVTINLAMSLAFLDKKVLVVGLDIRRPKLGEYLGIDNRTGITLYLSGHLDKSKLIRPSGYHPNMDVVTAGPVPPNPNELLMKKTLDDLMAEFREQYDYILLDTAPVGAVSDSFSLNRFADASVYVVRADYTPKRNIAEATQLYHQKKLNNMYFVVNAEDIQKITYKYGYGRKYGYGYGKKYGYGYSSEEQG